MTLYFRPDLLYRGGTQDRTVRVLAPVTQEEPQDLGAPSPWMRLRESDALNLCDLDTPPGREMLAGIIDNHALYRMSLELLIDKILLNAADNDKRKKAIAAAFAPEDVPETIYDIVAEQYKFAGMLKHPAIASLNSLSLLELYLRLYGAATPEHKDIQAHLAPIACAYPAKLLASCDGIMWRGRGWVRLDTLIYACERADHDPQITFESYVARGRGAAEKLHSDDAKTLLAAWISAEDVQEKLCRSIDVVLSLSDIKRLPRWVRADVFRILEREAMKQVFAEKLEGHMGDINKIPQLAEPIAANARGDVSPLIQQLLNQTLAVDGHYLGGGLAFAKEAAKRRAAAEKLF